MKLNIKILTLFAVISTSLFAQATKLTLNDVVYGGAHYQDFKPQYLNQKQWKDESTFTYVKDDSILVLENIKGKEKKFMQLKELEEIINHENLTSFPRYQWRTPQVLELSLSSSKVLYDIKSKEKTEINYPEEAQNIDFYDAGLYVAYTIDNNLYIATPDSSKIAVTNDDNKALVYGQTVSRNEFGITGGTFWANKAPLLAFYKKDESNVGDYPLVDITAREASVRMIKYPMAGMASEIIHIGIYNLASGTTTYLKTKGPDEHYLTNIAWSPNNKFLYVAELNRGQDTMQMNCYDTRSGDFVKTLFTETDKQYVEPQTPMVFLPNDDSKFIWQSRRDGYNHLYLYNTDGQLLQQLTQGPWEVTQLLGFDTKNENVFISSTEKSYLERHTYAVNLNTKSRQCLTKDAGYHYSTLSPKGNYLLDRWSDVETPGMLDAIATKNGNTTRLLTAPQPYQDYQLGTTQLLDITSADGHTTLTGRLITPPNFDNTKKYPTIIYVYGGPHSQLIKRSWKGGVQMWQHYMAQKGYVMFTVDNRGTSYRGADFEQVIHRQLGKNEMADQMKAYDYLCQLPYVDKERIGVFGWSFGGFMTTSLMTHYPEAFKAGVAGGPVIDWSNYEVMYDERYMDTPQENPEGYDSTKVTNYAKDLKGKLLIIHGGQDPVVVWQNSQKFIRQCVQDEVQMDYFIYPTHEHNVRGSDRVHLMNKISIYFDDFL